MKKINRFRNYSLKVARIGKKKKVKGFTLVELIVVIAIIGVLAAVLIPTMSGKVRDSRLATANDKAAKIAEQAGIIATELETGGTYSVAGNVYSCDSITINDSDEFGKALLTSLPELKGKRVYVEFDANGAVVKAVYAENTDTYYVGSYPTQTTVDDYKNKKTFSSFTGSTGE